MELKAFMRERGYLAEKDVIREWVADSRIELVRHASEAT